MDKQTQQTMFSSQSSEWATPQVFFERLNWRFGPFNLDPCASPDNAKCDIFYTEADDGLSKSWKGRIVFINPPYGRGVDEWVKKAYEETQADPDTRVVMLLPAYRYKVLAQLCNEGEGDPLHQGKIKVW